MSEIATTNAPLPADDLSRALAFAQLDSPTAQHIGLVGNTYTITVAGKDTNGRFCVIDMHVPPGGGPGPHRHDFEETFILLEGEVEMTFRGAKSIVRAGDTVNVPSNAPHQFHNPSTSPARMICICAPAGNERFFVETRGARSDAHYSATQARQDTDGGACEEGEGCGSEVWHGTSGTSLDRSIALEQVPSGFDTPTWV